MPFYVNRSTYSHIRKIWAGVLLATLIGSSVSASPAHADARLASPAWGTALAIRPDTGTLFTETDEVVVPSVEERPVALKTLFMDSTSYTSRPQETDGDPFVTADGSDVRDGIVATNVLPFGTKVRLPSVFGDRIFTVHDRMNARYSYRIDVWSSDLADAKRYGLKRRIPVEVVEWGDNKTQWTARTEKIQQARHVGRQRIQEVALK